ncbi:ABC transporter substrate-binding protein [uncultured Martelella sp.]|uniref:ABC transporter substrate-binding protein n=1 Tax=uncultured Martelella sp. TaxID=392331 RepID=UPI0029C6647E|nr:ABC transporter substrate-binding protein [uncultured Martelella sp.]
MTRKMLAVAGLALAASASTALVPAAAQDKVSIVVNATQVFGTIDPARINDYTEYMAAVNLYDGLTTVAGDGSIVPQLAESWTVSDDNLTYTFKLKDGATFQDGSPVEASDVVYTLKRLLAINEGPSYLFSKLIDPDKLKAVDSKTVEIGLTKVYAPFLTTTPLILVVNEDEAKANSDEEWASDYIASHSVGAGPYALEDWKRGSQMVVERYADYHGGWDRGTPIDEIRFVITNDEATVKALATKGELGMSSDSQANETYEAIGAMDGYKLIETPTATAFYIKMNTKLPPTDDIHVRRAIAYATDYATIREAIYPGSELSGPMASAFADAYAGDLPTPEYNLEKAREELAKSKYAGQDITLTHSYVAGLSFEEDIALLMQANLEQIGVTLDVRPEPWNRITELAAKPETTPNTTQVFNGPSYPSPDSVFYVQYDSAASGTWASMEWLQDPEVDALIEDARTTTEVDKQNDIYKELQRKIVAQQPDVFMLVENRRYAASNCLQGYEFVPMMSWDTDFSRFSWDCSAE